MDRHKSAEKRTRQNERRRMRNKGMKSAMRTAIKKASAEPKTENLNTTYSMIDKAVKKHLIHKKTAARMKSKLARTVSPKPKPQQRETSDKS
ncbi:30S ribosomal protein S20 [candidate division TA06 bacterium]|uniref:Small ribosomal subunit protein bS20 n=1 Tax=candidate division TA06 bacterium TaxID=2250710 RepID=A0A523UMM6_UNCT6|nr:MAG: 30S ribosomal protein S20 [candidate division TA06 bacterium]